MKTSTTLGLLILSGMISTFGCDDSDARPQQPSADSDAGPSAPSCPAPTGPGTVHEDYVLQDEIWTAAESPHRVDFDVVVRGATLTIEPCAIVEVRAGRGLAVDDLAMPSRARLVARGTASQPIVFRGQSAQRWRGITVEAPSVAELAYVTIEGGGDERGDAAMLHVLGDGVLPADPAIFLDHVTLQKARGSALRLERGATFLPGSNQLTVTQSGDGASQYAVEIEEHSLDALPVGSYTGNAVDEILLSTYGTGIAGGGLSVDATLHERGVPYHVGRSNLDPFVIGSGTEGELAVLTIEPGVILKMHPGTSFKIQHWTSEAPSTGALRAIGTAERPIVFTSAAATPAAGDWMGLWFGGLPSEQNAIEFARIEYAGGECSCSLNTCSAIEHSEGAVIFTGQPKDRFVRNSVVSDSAGHGFTQGFDGASLDFRDSNVFSNVEGCEVTEPRNVDTTCPSPKPRCK